jgi:hypothetical protein
MVIRSRLCGLENAFTNPSIVLSKPVGITVRHFLVCATDGADVARQLCFRCESAYMAPRNEFIDSCVTLIHPARSVFHREMRLKFVGPCRQ